MRERDDDAEFEQGHDRLARQRQERVERIGAVERGGEREKMHRQKNRQRDAGQPMQHGGDEAALPVRGAHHEVNTANTARRPRTRSRIANSASARSSERPRHAVHSRKTLRNPIGAWIATAMTKVA